MLAYSERTHHTEVPCCFAERVTQELMMTITKNERVDSSQLRSWRRFKLMEKRERA